MASLAEKFAFGPAAFGPIASRSPAEASDRTTLLSANDVVPWGYLGIIFSFWALQPLRNRQDYVIFARVLQHRSGWWWPPTRKQQRCGESAGSRRSPACSQTALRKDSGPSQRAQYCLIKEYTLNHIGILSNCFSQGLWTFGPPCSPVNTEVRPAFRYIMSEMHKLEPKNPKRVSIITTLVHACEDCQQVQAREILRIYGDLTSQNQTFEQQLKYSLLRQKEVALNRFITDKHKGCDLDHTQVQPQQQRPHLFSGYVAYIGEDFGLDGLDAATR